MIPDIFNSQKKFQIKYNTSGFDATRFELCSIIQLMILKSMFNN